MRWLALASRKDVEFKPTVNWCPENEVWSGNIGVITTLIPQVSFDPEKTIAVLMRSTSNVQIRHCRPKRTQHSR